MFIETCEGEIINLNHGVIARTFVWEPKDKFRFKMADGIEIVETPIIDKCMSLGEIGATVVKADPGCGVLNYVEGDGEREAFVERHDIIAWRIDLDFAHPFPITVGAFLKNEPILHPSGYVFQPEVSRWNSSEIWLEQQELDAEERRHKDAAAV